jgi:hypothetical protein
MIVVDRSAVIAIFRQVDDAENYDIGILPP